MGYRVIKVNIKGVAELLSWWRFNGKLTNRR
jgi:hypothetical protein